MPLKFVGLRSSANFLLFNHYRMTVSGITGIGPSFIYYNRKKMNKCEKKLLQEELQKQKLERLELWLDYHPFLQWLYWNIVINHLWLTSPFEVFLFFKLLIFFFLMMIAGLIFLLFGDFDMSSLV